MYRHFSTEFFVGNRKRLRELFVGTAPIVITANGVLQRNGDSNFKFRQDSSFWYLTGINQPDVVLVIDKNKEYLILPEQELYYDVFYGGYNEAELKQISGINTIFNSAEGWKKLRTRLGRVKHVATLAASPTYVKQLGLYTNPARRRLIRQVKAIRSDVELLDLRPQLSLMRMVKQTPEIEALQEAIDITIKAIKTVRRRTYKHEYEIEADLTSLFLKSGADDHGFTPIVAAGKNAAIIHHDRNNGPIGPKDLILLDLGAEVDNYTSDLSITYAQGAPTKRQKDVHNAILAVRDYAIEQLKPGITIRDNERVVEHFMGEKLRELGLIKTIDRESVRKFFPHATSHYLGLDPHDAGDYSRRLEPGVILTVEPGIYIPEEGLGMRIEDDILVTKDGCKVLSARLPRDIT